MLAGLALSGCGRPAGSPAAPAAKRVASPAAKPQPVVRSFTLTPGPGSPRQLAGGQIDAYEIDLEADQYLHVTFDQQGVDLGVDVFAPGAKKLFRIDNPNGAHGPEEVHLLAETAGRYRLEVSTDSGTPAGTYVPSLRALRPPSRQDRSQAGADRAFYEAKEIDAKPERFWEATAKYQRSVFLFHEAGDRWHEAYAFLRAVNTGHPGSMTTVHADSPERAVEQIVLLVLQGGTQLGRDDVRHYVSRTIDVYVQLTRTGGKRRISDVVLRS